MVNSNYTFSFEKDLLSYAYVSILDKDSMKRFQKQQVHDNNKIPKVIIFTETRKGIIIFELQKWKPENDQTGRASADGFRK